MRINKNISLVIIIVFSLICLVSCKKDSDKKCQHIWNDATCTTAKTCSVCGETEGSALEHAWNNATCTSPKTCSICGTTEGSVLGHTWNNATCTSPKTCSICGATEGSTLSHSWIDATYDTPKTCSVCGETTGSPLTKLVVTVNKTYIHVGSSTLIYIDGYDITDFNIEYSEEGIISIDEWSRVKGLTKGEVTVTLTYIYDNTLKGSFSIEVINVLPTCYLLYDKMKVGDSTPIFFKNLVDLEEESIDDFNITFANLDVLAFENGKIIAKNVGTETITITSKLDERITTTCNVTVIDQDESISISGRDELGTAKEGEQIQLEYHTNITGVDFVWCTSNDKIAVINEYGILTVNGQGYVTVSVYDANNVSNKTHRANYYLYIEGEVEVDYVSRLIHTALKENGIKETGSNIQKYGEWYPNNGQPWCAMFVSWCWYHAGLSNDLLLKYQGCYAGMKWCTEQGIMHFVQDYTFGETLDNGVSSKQYAENYRPKAGDIVFFLSAGMGHTGIAIHSDSQYLYTIEGNTSDQVAIKRWSLQDARITGYASPKYPEYSKEREDFSWIKDKKADGTYWWTNVSEQQKVD